MSLSDPAHSAAPPHVLPDRDASEIFAFIVAMTCGILLGLSMHVILMRYGTSLTAPWRDLFPTEADKREAAMAWWTEAAAACTGGFFAKRLLDQHRADHVRLAAALILFGVFAFAGHLAAAPDAVHGFAQTLASLCMMALAAVMALCGVYAAYQRRDRVSPRANAF